MEIKEWRVVAPNGVRLSINMGGYGDAKFNHGQITNNAKAAEQFPQYFLPINSERAIEAAPVEESAPAPKPTLEEEMLNESKEESENEKKPQMLTEVPKPVEIKPEEKEEAVDVENDAAPLLVEKKKRSRKSK